VCKAMNRKGLVGAVEMGWCENEEMAGCQQAAGRGPDHVIRRTIT
jgi:hypothetical protein